MIALSTVFCAAASFVVADEVEAPKSYLWLRGTGINDPGINFDVPGELLSDAVITIEALVMFGEDCVSDGGCVYLNCYSYASAQHLDTDHLISFADYAKESDSALGEWRKAEFRINPYNGTYGKYAGKKQAPEILTMGVGFWQATGTVNVGYISIYRQGELIWHVDFENGLDTGLAATGGTANIREDNENVDWGVIRAAKESPDVSEEEQSITYGDYDGDGEVTSDDAVYLLRHTLFSAQYPLQGYADLDGDGEVTSDDAVYLLRHTLFPDSYPLVVRIPDSVYDEYLAFTLLDNGCFEVRAREGAAMPKKLVIPATYGGRRVVSVARKGFAGLGGFKSVTIEEGVESVGARAFHNCPALTEARIPRSVMSIGAQIFYGSDSLKTVYYFSDYFDVENPVLAAASIEKIVFGGTRAGKECAGPNIRTVEMLDGVTYIDEYAFRNCAKLKEVTLPDSVGKIGVGAFAGCSALSRVTIPRGLDGIESYTFSDCTGLKNVTIPETLKYIDDFAFSGCTGLDGVFIDDLAAWCSVRFGSTLANPLEYAHYLFLNNRIVTELVIPDGVTEIGHKAFSGCSALRKVTIPPSVRSIGGNAFSGCYTLTGIYISDLAAWCGIKFDWDNPLFYAHELYLKGERVTELVIPDGVTKISAYAFSYCIGLTGVAIPDTVAEIGAGAFEYCSGIGSVTIPDSVAKIGAGAFYSCTGLTSVSIPDSVINLGGSAFENCIRLRSATIPESITKIEYYTFSGCAALKDVNVPDSVTKIGKNAFSGCGELKNIHYTGTAAQWNAISKEYCWDEGAGSYTVRCSDGNIGG